MSGLETVPLWLSIPIALFVILGSNLTLIGAWGFLRLSSFYDRLHAPTLATSWGTGGVTIASALLASWLQDRSILHELIIGFAVIVTVPVTLMLLARASLHRDRMERAAHLPPELLLMHPSLERPSEVAASGLVE
ncbi:monovalent cation/H(+) antiporter subunit G [Paracoccus sp. YLB-12]|uniref:Monovalent cation/H(+) antiporter subunit G n=1 Tax=Paracoccus maritimus TaxID=2933292 RepID=A0ABT2KA52_9RHOB|nr:monovalent cation/H(+) antiporter subunit G [Paracoccus sp. YLB-12]MCT4332779.1 monovalent cation/H(+) antiporter subunit G [Paracoccus sp. YLB-12]